MPPKPPLLKPPPPPAKPPPAKLKPPPPAKPPPPWKPPWKPPPWKPPPWKPPPKPPRASAAVGVRAPSAATVARAIIVLRNMTTSLHNVRGHKRCRRRIVALWRAEQELNSPARVQNLAMSPDRRPMSGSFCRQDACAISDKIAPFSSQSLP